MQKPMKPVFYRTEEGLYVHNKGEEGVREQQKEYKSIIDFFKNEECLGAWDFGAHVGWFPWYVNTNIICRSILCVECSPNQLKMLKRNIPDNAELLEGAIVSDDYVGDTLDLYLGKKYSSCDTVFPVRGRRKVTVPVLKMCQIVEVMPEPELVKFDMEGAEYCIDLKKWLPDSVKMLVAELHHQRPGHLQKQEEFHRTMVSLGFKTDKPPKENTFKKTCHVSYTRDV